VDFEALWTKISKDGHIPIGFLIFVVGSAIHIFHGLDASFVAFTTACFGFLGGHAYVQANAPPDPSAPPPTSPAPPTP